MRSLALTLAAVPNHLGYFNDPRHAQIMCLGVILSYGLWSGAVSSQTTTLVAIGAGVMATEYGLFKWRNPAVPATFRVFKSSLITCLSLCLLMRLANPWFGLMAGSLAIMSKTMLRSQHGHWFNPANFALVVCTLALDGAWISPGQWGHTLWLGIVLGAAGLMVCVKASRLDTALWFLLSYTIIIFSRAYWLGDPWAIALQQLQNSALLIFAFFMLSDPKTSPRHATARAVYGFIIAALGSYFQFQHFQSLGLFYSLFIGCACVPFLNYIWCAPSYEWQPKR